MITLITIIVVLILTIYLYLKQKFSYFAKRGIPYIKHNSPLGNMWKSVIFLENMNDTIDKICVKNRDKGIYGVFNGTMPVLILTDPDLVKDVLVKEFSHFHDRGFIVNEDINPLENHLLNLEGTKWKVLRNKLSPTFTTGKLKGMLPLMEECCNDFTKTVKIDEDNDMKKLFGRLAAQVIASCAFGINADALYSDDNPFIKHCDSIANPGFGLFFRFMFSFGFPKFARAIGMTTWPEDMNKFFFDLVREGFAMRKNQQVVRNDFLQVLLELKEKGEIQVDDKHEDDEPSVDIQDHSSEETSKIILDDVLLTAQAFVFIAGGYETTSSALAFVGYLFSKHKEIQEKARAEVMEVKQKYGKFTYEALKDLVYVEACIKEALRLYPPVPIHGRICTKPTKVGGFDIEKGVMIFIPANSIQRDPNNFSNPEDFRPERFFDDDINEYAYIPFGSGPRICIGLRFAMLEMKLAIAKLLEQYSFDLSSKMQNSMKTAAISFSTIPEGGLHAVLRKLK